MSEWLDKIEHEEIRQIISNACLYNYCEFDVFLDVIRKSVRPNGNMIKREDINHAYNIFSIWCVKYVSVDTFLDTPNEWYTYTSTDSTAGDWNVYTSTTTYDYFVTTDYSTT